MNFSVSGDKRSGTRRGFHLNPIAYGILSLSQLQRGGGGTPQKAQLDSLIDSKFVAANYYHKNIKITEF